MYENGSARREPIDLRGQIAESMAVAADVIRPERIDRDQQNVWQPAAVEAQPPTGAFRATREESAQQYACAVYERGDA